MWKRMILAMVATLVQEKLLDYVMTLSDVQKKSDAITLLKNIKVWLRNSHSSTTRTIASLIPFGEE